MSKTLPETIWSLKLQALTFLLYNNKYSISCPIIISNKYPKQNKSMLDNQILQKHCLSLKMVLVYFHSSLNNHQPKYNKRIAILYEDHNTSLCLYIHKSFIATTVSFLTVTHVQKPPDQLLSVIKCLQSFVTTYVRMYNIPYYVLKTPIAHCQSIKFNTHACTAH